MAKVIDTNIQSEPVAIGYYSPLRVGVIGAVLGVLYWCLVTYIGHFSNSATVPSDVATIIVATAGIGTMVYFRMAQPFITAVASALSLWGLTYLTSGLSGIETIAWSVLLYTLAYSLFSWICRYSRITPVLIVIISVIIIARITASF
ncbi:hypothetical protein HGB25_00885 [Candidatus Saccharibacteria bacterium]|nr:hypothetical protein [Candidatus Saccharibacteria bacterium]